jgi:hypothetical protein
MAGFTNAYELTVLDAAVVAAHHLALFTTDPGETGVVTGEVSTTGTAYARIVTTGLWAAAASGAIANNAALEFVEATGAGFGHVTHWGLCSAGTAGVADVQIYGELTTHLTVASGETVRFAIGDLTITLD